jgi:hypothetical protein
MVDALRSTWRVLRKGGVVVLMLPAARYAPRLALVRDGGRTELGRVTHTPDPDVIAAHRARRRAVAEGWFSLAASTHGAHGARYPSLADVRWVVRQNTNWHVGAREWRRLAAAWSRRPRGAKLEIRRTFAIAFLRKRG